MEINYVFMHIMNPLNQNLRLMDLHAVIGRFHMDILFNAKEITLTTVTPHASDLGETQYVVCGKCTNAVSSVHTYIHS
jgi:hypothetical protein